MATIQVTEEIRRGRNQLAFTVVLGHTVKHIYNSGLQSVILAVIKDDLGLSGTQFGLLATSQRVTSGTTTMVAGYLGDRFANRSGLMLMLSLGIMGISYYLMGSAPSYWFLFAVMLLVGIGPSLYHPPAIASLSRKFPDRRGFAISLHGTGGSVGEVVGPVLTGGLISGTYLVAFEWRDVLTHECASGAHHCSRCLPDDEEHSRRGCRCRVAGTVPVFSRDTCEGEGDALPRLCDSASKLGAVSRDGVPARLPAGRPGLRESRNRPVHVRRTGNRHCCAAPDGVFVGQVRTQGRTRTVHARAGDY